MPKFILKRAELVDKLNVVSLGLARIPVLQIHQHFVFDGEMVSAYNDTICVQAPCKAGSFALHGNTLLGLLASSTAEDASFDPGETHVVVKTARSTFTLPFLGEDAFLFEAPTDEWLFETSISETVLNGLKAALLTVSNDLSKQAMMGVCLIRNAKEMAIYSCDGDGLTKAPLKGKGDELRFMIPSDFCTAIIKVIADTDANAGSLTFTSEWAVATFDNGYKVFGRLFEPENPLDYESVVKTTLKKVKNPTYSPVPEGLLEGLGRAQVITKLETVHTTLAAQSGRLKLVTLNSVGEVRDSFAFQHPEVTANVSAELTMRAIKLCPEMSIQENCVAYRHPETGLFVLVSNME